MPLPIVYLTATIISNGLTALGTAGFASPIVAQLAFEGEARIFYAERFPAEATLKDIVFDSPAYNALTDPQKADRLGAISEYNAFVHTYVSARFVEVLDDMGLSQQDAIEVTKLLGDGREAAREVTERFFNTWTEDDQKDQNKDRWNNDVGADLGTQGLTNAEKADYIEDQINAHRADVANGSPYSGDSDIVISITNDTRAYTGNTYAPDVNGIDELEGIDPIEIDFGDSDEDGIPDPYDFKPIPDYVDSILDKFEQGEARGSPLILDLNHSGTIDLISLANSTAYFDRNEDGFAEASGIADSVDGYLALDINSNGRIDDNGELFGNMTTDGFTVLGLYDSNADDKITAEDVIWNDLIIWQDTNENGYSEDTELYTLADHNIISINLNATAVSQTNQGHDVTHTSTFTVTGASTYAIHDVWFEFDPVNTVFIDDFTPDMRVAFLPTLRGYGTIADLFIAMSGDNTGTGNLLDLVKGLKYTTFAQLFDATTATHDLVTDIMFRWAGVDGVSPTSRGNAVDAQELEFLEALMGQGFLQHGYAPNPGPEAAFNLHEAFVIAHSNIYARLLAQSAGGELFEGDFFYNVSTDAIEGITGLNAIALAALETEATGLANTATREAYWLNVLRMVEFAAGVDQLPSGDQTALSDAIEGSDTALDMATLLNALDGNASMYGSGDNDDIDGDTLGNTLYGYAGNDRIDAWEGSDTLTGGTGSDYLLGGWDSDTYAYADGDGWDTINDTGGSADVIQFGSGIDAGDITLTRAGQYGLLAEIDNGTNTGQIHIENMFWPDQGIETLDFVSGSDITLSTYHYTLNGTAGPGYFGVSQGNIKKFPAFKRAIRTADGCMATAANDNVEHCPVRWCVAA